MAGTRLGKVGTEAEEGDAGEDQFGVHCFGNVLYNLYKWMGREGVGMVGGGNANSLATITNV